MSAAASAKQESFVMSTSHTAQSGRRQRPDRQINFTHIQYMLVVVHLRSIWAVCLKAPRNAQGRGADGPILTVPSGDMAQT
jgi:hypothetical protein